MSVHIKWGRAECGLAWKDRGTKCQNNSKHNRVRHIKILAD